MRPIQRTLAIWLSFLVLAVFLPAVCAAQTPAPTPAGAKPEIMPLSQVKPGMKGTAYTIFEGDTIDAFDVEVIGVQQTFFGPKQDIILVRLKGPKPEYTGVTFGMSGTPIYLEGKLAGALSLLISIFAKEPIAGVTPIERILEIPEYSPPLQRASAVPSAVAPGPEQVAAGRYPLPGDAAFRTGVGSGAYLAPIDTPLTFSGFHPETLRQFGEALRGFGMVAAPGGTAEARPDDADLKPGDMASMVLMRGDLSLQASCTVTAIIGNKVYVCGHPFFGFGDMEMPMARGRVVTTVASTLASTKIVNAGGTIGTFQQDMRTAVVGKLGATPEPGKGMIPVDLEFSTPAAQKRFHFEVIEHPKLTPLLVAIAAFNGLIANTAYSEGNTLQLSGEITIKGHSAVTLENMFAPTDQFVPDGLFVALNLQGFFARVFGNPYERAQIEKVRLNVTSLPERRSATIDNAWSEKSEVSPGEQLGVKVLLRPYRGTPVMKEVSITIPQQVPKGLLRIVVSDADTVNRMGGRIFALNPLGRLAGLEQLITLLNRERSNSRLYVTLLQPTPTLLVEDKELPNAPVSQINVLDQRRTGNSLLLRESAAGEWSIPMNQVISGQFILTVLVK